MYRHDKNYKVRESCALSLLPCSSGIGSPFLMMLPQQLIRYRYKIIWKNYRAIMVKVFRPVALLIHVCSLRRSPVLIVRPAHKFFSNIRMGMSMQVGPPAADGINVFSSVFINQVRSFPLYNRDWRLHGLVLCVRVPDKCCISLRESFCFLCCQCLIL